MHARSKWACLVMIILAALLVCSQSPAASAEPYVPDSLAPWKDWALHGLEKELCPPDGANPSHKVCAFPTSLKLWVNATQGEFEMTWRAFAPVQVPLPRSKNAWPVQVGSKAGPIPVVNAAGVPNINIGPGTTVVHGRFDWAEPPQMMTLPRGVGLVELFRDGIRAAQPAFEPDGSLRLAKVSQAAKPEDRFDLTIFRLLEDSLPFKTTTHLRLNVSGKIRRIQLKKILPPGSIPMAVSSPVSISFAPDGGLNVQAGAGRFEIEVVSRFMNPVAQLGPLDTPYGREIWSFAASRELRDVEVRGVPGVDPQTTDMPQAWKKHPAFLVESGATIVLHQAHRGEPGPLQDSLNISRTLWLDFNGRGFSVRDVINGEMRKSRTLAMAGPGELGRVVMRGKDQPIVLLDPDSKKKKDQEKLSGIEVRDRYLNLEAESRYNNFHGSLPGVGWDHDFQRAENLINLPPGWRLAAATGADQVQNSWVGRWNLMDFFLTLIISLAAWKLRGLIPGLAVCAFLVLAYHERNAPLLTWIFLLVSLAASKLISDSSMLSERAGLKRAAEILYAAALVSILAVSVVFVIQQIRWGIYPQLEPRWDVRTPYMTSQIAPPKATMKTAPAPKGKQPQAFSPEEMRDEAVMEKPGLGQKLYRRDQAGSGDWRQGLSGESGPPQLSKNLMYDPEALVQTGPGMPQWNWRTARLAWSGPVEREQKVRLYLVSPRVNLLLGLARVFLLLASLWLTADLSRLKAAGGPFSSKAASLALAPLLFMLPLKAHAAEAAPGFPPQEMIQDLRQRLLEPAQCFPYCIGSPRIEVRLDQSGLRLDMEIHALAETTVPLPVVSSGASQWWTPDAVLLDENPGVELIREQGVLKILVSKGVHRAVLTGPTPDPVSFTISLPLQPGTGIVRAQGWDVQGIDQDGRVEGAIQLSRAQEARESGPALEETHAIPNFLHIERRLTLGLTWEARTTVMRVTPPGEPVVLKIPLLPNESVLSEGVEVKDSMVVMNMDSRQRTFEWSSRLNPSGEIKLLAPENTPWVETWILEPAQIWHVEYEGIPVVKSENQAGEWTPKWRPWPGEKLELKVSRPPAAPGESLTIDSAGFVFNPGLRIQDCKLVLSIRASKGGRHAMTPPKGVEISSLRLNGRDIAWKEEKDGRISFPVSPGMQQAELKWRDRLDEEGAGQWLIKTPLVDLGHAAVNINTSFVLPRDRWVLFTWGEPLMGPAVLFWSHVGAILIGALLLGRLSWTPLRSWHWFLLGLGLTQVSPIAAFCAVAWIFALGLRGERHLKSGWFCFDLIQIALALLTMIGLVSLYMAIQNGLLGLPEMQVSGNGSSAYNLKWTMDRTSGPLPETAVVSLPLYCYRAFMLLWSLWMAYYLLRWLKWGWECFSREGILRKPGLSRFKLEKADKPEQEGPPPLS